MMRRLYRYLRDRWSLHNLRERREPPIIGHRWARGLMYLCISVSGIVLWFLDIPFLENIIGYTYLIISVFLLVGGTVSGLGHLIRSVLVEKAGYPLVLAALACLTGTLFRESDQQAARLFIALLVFAFTLGLYGRWRDLGTLQRVDREITARGDHANGGQ